MSVGTGSRGGIFSPWNVCWTSFYWQSCATGSVVPPLFPIRANGCLRHVIPSEASVSVQPAHRDRLSPAPFSVLLMIILFISQSDVFSLLSINVSSNSQEVLRKSPLNLVREYYWFVMWTFHIWEVTICRSSLVILVLLTHTWRIYIYVLCNTPSYFELELSINRTFLKTERKNKMN